MVNPVNPITIKKNPAKKIIEPLILVLLMKNCRVPHTPINMTNPPMKAI
jgi:uncharacterized lipoprotein YajG